MCQPKALCFGICSNPDLNKLSEKKKIIGNQRCLNSIYFSGIKELLLIVS